MKCTNCTNCARLLKSTSVAITGTTTKELQITIPERTFNNLENYCLIVCQTIPTDATDIPVVLVNGKDVIPVLYKKGNNLQGWQIRSRVKYKVVYGNDEEHILVYNHSVRRC